MNGDVYMSDVSAPSTPGPTRMSTRPRLPSFAGREPQTLAEAAAMRATPGGADYERATRSKTTKPKIATAKALVVEERIENEDEVSGSSSKTFNISDFIWGHGITPPLRHVRKRRFRKRISRAAIETVEQEMERLLDLDSQADQVEYKVLENVNPDLSDSEFDPDIRAKRGSSTGLDFYDGAGTPNFAADAPTPGGADGLDMEEGDGEPENDDGSDDDLAAELERALAGEDEGDDDEEEEDEDEDETDEEEEEDGDAELTQAKKLLYEEIQDLEAVIEKKTAEIARIENPVLKSRLEASFNLKKLKADLESKRAMLEALTAKPIEEDVLEAEPAEDDADADDLFGDDEEDEVAEAVPAAPAAPSEAPTAAPAPAAGPVVIQLSTS
ncbi:hypothetical protein FRC01_009189 [Tulasnella sp. 417]|nr:hypothetical protein FRC01_009189 [Tulasnella sp. 417]